MDIFGKQVSGRTRVAAQPVQVGPLAAVSPIARLETRKRPVRYVAALFMALVIVALVALEAWSRFNAYQNALRDSQISTTNIARATAEHAENTINLIDTILWGLMTQVEIDGAQPAQRPRLHTLMVAQVERTPSLEGLFIYDPSGAWVVNSLTSPLSKANNADREYFIYHRDHPGRQVHIGQPVQSRSTGNWVLPLSRRLQSADGNFAGVILATIKIDFFQSFYNAFNIGNNGAILLATGAGQLVVRRPFKQGLIGSDISQGPVFDMMRGKEPRGTAMLVSKIDHIERMYSYQHLASYPMTVAAALAKQEILAPWRASTQFEASAIGALMCIIMFAAWKLYTQILIRDRLEHALRLAQHELERNNGTLQDLALKDGLTGLGNRRHFDLRLGAEFARAARCGAPLALVLIDVDHFKRYNDTYGHDAGDQCLKAVSTVVGQFCRRPGDEAARFGGEEFVLLLPETDGDGALAVAAALCKKIELLALPHATSGHGFVSVSAGVYSCTPAPGHTERTLIDAADRGLYRAKGAGRNRAQAGSEACELEPHH